MYDFCLRFPETELISSFGILSMRPISFLSGAQLETWGCEQLDFIIHHFGKEAVSSWKDEDGTAASNISCPLVDAQATREEWQAVKETVMAQLYPRDNTHTLWKLISQYHGDSFPNLIKLA